MTDPAVRTRIQVCIDCSDDQAPAEFWAQALDYERHSVGGRQHNECCRCWPFDGHA